MPDYGLRPSANDQRSTFLLSTVNFLTWPAAIGQRSTVNFPSVNRQLSTASFFLKIDLSHFHRYINSDRDHDQNKNGMLQKLYFPEDPVQLTLKHKPNENINRNIKQRCEEVYPEKLFPGNGRDASNDGTKETEFRHQGHDE